MYIYIYTHTYIHTCIHTCMHTYMYTCNTWIKKGIQLSGNSSDFRLWLFAAGQHVKGDNHHAARRSYPNACMLLHTCVRIHHIAYCCICVRIPQRRQPPCGAQVLLQRLQAAACYICMSAYCHICVRILPYLRAYAAVCPHTAISVSSYCNICVLRLLMRPHAAIDVSSCCYKCVRILL